MWDLSCTDWRERMRAGRSLIPNLPLIESEAEFGLQVFDQLQLPDVPKKPIMREAAGPWFRDIVRTAFGSWDPVAQERYIRDIFLLAPKAQSKTTYDSGLMLTGMVMNMRPNAEALFIGPTQNIADRAYEQAVGMIEASLAMKRRFQTIDHEKTILDRVNKSKLMVKTFSLKILTGSILIFVLLDELHLLGPVAHTAKVLRQIRGGLDKTPEGLLIITTTQSDDIPAGAFKDELTLARETRDGLYRGKIIRPMLPILYELPEEIAKDPEEWQDPQHWPMVMPNLGRSSRLPEIIRDWESERTKGEHAVRIWASQYLNVEIGTGLKSGAWPGARFWDAAADPDLTLEAILERSEVVVVGIDGGGLDDLFGLAVIGREKGTRRWLAWCHAWAHASVLELRKSIASTLLDFKEVGELTIHGLDKPVPVFGLPEEGAEDDEPVSYGVDIDEAIAIIKQVDQAGLLAYVGLDPVGVGAVVDALSDAGIGGEDRDESGRRSRVVAVSQGWKLTGAIKTAERKLVDGTFIHADQAMMSWCVGNAKAEPRGNALMITKQAAGTAKIDPLMALFDAVALMSENPEVPGSVYTAERGLLVFG